MSKRDISELQWQQLRSLSGPGVTLHEAAAKLGINRNRLARSARRTGRAEELRALFPRKVGVHPVLTDEVMKSLERQARAGVRKPEAAKSLGCCEMTMDKQARLQGRIDEIREMFPKGGNSRDRSVYGDCKDEGLQKAGGAEVSIPQSPAAKWLTRSWRAA